MDGWMGGLTSRAYHGAVVARGRVGVLSVRTYGHTCTQRQILSVVGALGGLSAYVHVLSLPAICRGSYMYVST